MASRCAMTAEQLDAIKLCVVKSPSVPSQLVAVLLQAYLNASVKPDAVVVANLQRSRDLAVARCQDWLTTVQQLHTIEQDLQLITTEPLTAKEAAAMKMLMRLTIQAVIKRFDALVAKG